ncbi:hypothetical protein ETD86_48790 [Nonomuraea turkmeniaca]|uniref:Tc1-like transposase DDE domain-containing protein n=1 Tax=Nonomuraea turkmeniaca TaxID=103838 RepID=A0A5S4EX31_9ACTN|nr:hypothetical protein [Nonomuraea turkmeniaca]TMR08213.1 hypothetical protein ETD86_48790 [Nonomuraea turkmeniaca]
MATHLQLDAPLVWCWDNLNIHLAADLANFAEQNKDWLRILQFPTYAMGQTRTGGSWTRTET